MSKYKPATKEELKNLVFTDSVKLSDVDTSLITDMSYLFHKTERKDFEGIEDWDTSNVEDMSFMFFGEIDFNHTLNNWNVSNVKNMSGMFQAAIKFNQPLDKWDTSNVINMKGMFSLAKTFNQNINNWNVSKVEDLSYMFWECDLFNQPLNDWDVSNVKTMEGTFRRAYKFNQPLYKWDTSNVRTMSFMFNYAKAFNQPLDKWNTKNLKKMYSMFEYAKNYDCYDSLANWNLSKVSDIRNFCTNDERFYEKLPLRLRVYMQAFYGPHKVFVPIENNEEYDDEYDFISEEYDLVSRDYITITKENVKEVYNSISKDTNKKVLSLKKRLESEFSEELSFVTNNYNFKTIEEAEKYVENNYNKKDDKKVNFINDYKVLIKDKSREVENKVLKYIYLEYLLLKRDVKKLVQIDNIVNLLDKESFIKFIKNVYDENNKETATFVYGIYGGDEALKNIYNKVHDTKLSLITIKLNNQSKYALKLLYKIFMTTKKTEVRLEAKKIINELLEIMNIDYAEFRLRYALDFGFNSKGEKVLNEDYKLILNNDYYLTLFDIKNNKELKKIPKNLDKKLKEKITKLRKEIKKFLKNNSNLLDITLINGNKYSYDIFKDIFIDNVMMNRFASSLIWNLYDNDNVFLTTFRYSGDGSYSNCEDEEIKINDNNFISLASPIEMDDDTINKWRKQLEDYEIAQPLQQLTVIKLDKNNLEKEINKIKNINTTYSSFKYFTKKYKMNISNVIGYDGIITYSFSSNDEDIFTMTSKIQGEYDEQINITIDFKKSENKKEISKRFVYTLLVLIIWDFRLTDLF